jgi:site-specific recombinase XerD
VAGRSGDVTTLALEPRYTLAEWAAYHRDPTKDNAYQRNSRLGPVVRDYLAWKRVGRSAEATLDAYERTLARLCRDLPNHAPADVTSAELMVFIESFPPGSWPKVRSHLSTFFRYCVQWDHCVANPVDRVPSMRSKSKRVYDIFAMTEQAKLVAAQDNSLLPQRDRLGVLIFQLGVRKNEARLLQPHHFDITARVVFVQGKGGKERIVPFDEDMWFALMEFMNTEIPQVRARDKRGRWYVEQRLPKDDDYIFFPYGATGRDETTRILWADPSKPMSKTAMHRWWVSAVDRAGIRYRSLHMNRHTTGTNLVDADVDSFSVRDWLGHADTRTTEVYVHNSRQRLQRAAERLTLLRRSAEGDRS